MKKPGLKSPKISRMAKLYSIKAFPRNNPPHKVAWAVFCGVWIGVLPTIGIAIPLTLLACWAFKLPKAAGVASSFVAIPPTLFPFFYPLGYWVGRTLLRPAEVDLDLLDMVAKTTLSNVGDQMSLILSQAEPHFYAFLIGMLIVATITASLFWCIAYFIVSQKRAQQSRNL